MWCDDFDGDLYKVVPGAREVLAPLASIRMWTTGHETGGKLNHPTVWNSNGRSMLSWFGLRPEAPQPDFYSSGSPLVACTLEEAVRDLWVHCPTLLRLNLGDGTAVNLWDSAEIEQHFWALLWHARGEAALMRGGDVEHHRAGALARLRALAARAAELGLLDATPPSAGTTPTSATPTGTTPHD